MNKTENVILNGLSIEMTFALRVINNVYERNGITLTVTCGLDGNHMAGSLHPCGYAVDIRTKNIVDSKLVLKIVNEIRDDLRKINSRYSVLLETSPPHIHIQYIPQIYLDFLFLYEKG